MSQQLTNIRCRPLVMNVMKVHPNKVVVCSGVRLLTGILCGAFTSRCRSRDLWALVSTAGICLLLFTHRAVKGGNLSRNDAGIVLHRVTVFECTRSYILSYFSASHSMLFMLCYATSCCAAYFWVASVPNLCFQMLQILEGLFHSGVHANVVFHHRQAAIMQSFRTCISHAHRDWDIWSAHAMIQIFFTVLRSGSPPACASCICSCCGLEFMPQLFRVFETLGVDELRTWILHVDR